MAKGISLADKCLLLFGAAVVVIILASLTIPWVRMDIMANDAEHRQNRATAAAYLQRMLDNSAPPTDLPPGASIALVPLEPPQDQPDAASDAAGDAAPANTPANTPDPAFVERAREAFTEDPALTELTDAEWIDTTKHFRIAIPAVGSDPPALLVLDRPSEDLATRLFTNTAYLLGAGLIALGLAVAVFYLITNRLILSPVRELRTTAESVRRGNLETRSEIATGDEFEELADTFNQMLASLAQNQRILRGINASLDLKVSQLAERNLSLFEANKLKGDFLASVSHELRTPLNSIIGFAELLREQVDKDIAQQGDSVTLDRRKRYLDNILLSGRTLLDMINSLLDLARAEAGKLEVHPDTLSVADLCEGLVALVRPLADRSGVSLVTQIPPDLPTIETDPKKAQQIVFNLLSNAIKFTAAHAQQTSASLPSRRPSKRPLAQVTLRAEKLPPVETAPTTQDRHASPARTHPVRISVIDTGPGIPNEQLSNIFEKFHQLDTGHTRTVTGTGLGLAICKELASLIQAELHVDSEPGRGSMFSVLFPPSLDPQRQAETKLEASFRASLTSQRPGTQSSQSLPLHTP